MDNLRVKFWKIFDFGPSKIVISAKGQFAEVVAYNIIDSKMSFENLENFDFDVWKIALSAKGQFAEVVVYNIIESLIFRL